MGTAGIGGERVAELRKARGLTQVALARRAGVSLSLRLRAELDQTITLRRQANLAGLLRMLPGLLTRITTYAHAAASPQGWALLGRRVQRRLLPGRAASLDGPA